MKRVCIKCGKEFDSTRSNTQKVMCDECVAEQRANIDLTRDKVCVDCGMRFVGYPRSLRCPSCNETHKKVLRREQAQRKRKGKYRPIGSKSVCEICGKKYVVASGKQKYCPDCAKQKRRDDSKIRMRKWVTETGYNEKRKTERKMSNAKIRCVVCGKMFNPHSPTTTCSPECSKKLAKMSAQAREKAHQKERNEYHKKLRAEKIAAMTAEEYAEYREKVNAKARENYKKRKEKSQQ